MFEGVPDLHVVVLRSVQSEDVTWSEWHWWGIRRDGRPFDMRGVTIFEIAQGPSSPATWT
jgi:hypothetical protein